MRNVPRNPGLPLLPGRYSHARAEFKILLLYVGDLREERGRPGLKRDVRRLWGDVHTPFYLL